MGTTTNNGWPTPVATDLVKDGWEAIKDLGDAIDTTLGVYAPSTSGLTLINTTSFSAVASQSVNSVFSTTYDNYILAVTLNTPSTAANLQYRMRTGSDDSTANYFSGASRVSYSSSLTTVGQVNAGTLGTLHEYGSGSGNNCWINLINPFLTQRMGIHGTYSTSDGYVGHTGGIVNTTTSYTGITLIASSGTLTGSVSIFGVNK